MWTFPVQLAVALVETDIPVLVSYKAILHSKFMPHLARRITAVRILWTWPCTKRDARLGVCGCWQKKCSL
jgi:hypothetical protein